MAISNWSEVKPTDLVDTVDLVDDVDKVDFAGSVFLGLRIVFVLFGWLRIFEFV